MYFEKRVKALVGDKEGELWSGVKIDIGLPNKKMNVRHVCQCRSNKKQKEWRTRESNPAPFAQIFAGEVCETRC